MLRLLIPVLSTCLLSACFHHDNGHNNNPSNSLSLTTDDTSVAEYQGEIIITASLTRAAEDDDSFTLSLTAGTADNSDVILNETTLVIPAGQTSTSTTIAIIDDDLPEEDESFTLTLSAVDNPDLAASLTITIEDNDGLPGLTDQERSWGPTGVFTAAMECGACHIASAEVADPAVLRAPDELTPAQPSPHGEDISPFTGWDHSVMANSLTDPYFRANVAQEAEHFPELAGFIEDTCMTCHAPMGRTHAHQTDTSLTDGYYRMETAMTEPHAREGISCTLCHQISDSVLSGDVNSGAYEIANAGSPAAATIFGPYQNPKGTAMQNQVDYTPAFGAQMQESEHCAACHTLYTPTIDIHTNQPTGDNFPEQTPYAEWLHGDFGDGKPGEKSCQECHMASPNDTYQTRIAVKPNGEVNESWPERTPYFAHEMVGANGWLLDILGEFREELGLSQVSSAEGFAEKAALTRDFLSTAATLGISSTAINSGVLSFDLTITNNAGHKLPTSFPARRMWLGVTVTDASGTHIFSSGIPDEKYRLPVDDIYAGDECLEEHKDESFDSTQCYMPHINTVTDASQIPIYEVVLGSTDDHVTHVLLYADERLKDNRIPPAGFDNASADEDIAPVGTEADSNFNNAGSGSDTVSYQLTLPAGYQAPLTIKATLYYQSIRPSFLDGLHGEHEFIDHLHRITAMNPPPAEIMAEVSGSL